MAGDALTGNAADEDQVKEAAAKEKSGRDLELEDLRAVLAAPQGRRLIWRYLKECGIFRNVAKDAGIDIPNATNLSERVFFNAGRQNLGGLIRQDIEDADPEAYLKMLAEERFMIERDKLKPKRANRNR